MSNKFDNPGDGEPREITAGDLWAWRRDDLAADYPPADYTLKYFGVSRAASPITFDLVAQASQGGYLVSVPSATTAAIAAGEYDWTAVIVRNADNARVEVDEGRWTIEADPIAGADPRSYQERLLDAIEAVLEGKVTKDVSSYSIEGRQLVKIPIPELMEIRDKMRRELAAEERRRSGAGRLKTHPVNFL